MFYVLTVEAGGVELRTKVFRSDTDKEAIIIGRPGQSVTGNLEESWCRIKAQKEERM